MEDNKTVITAQHMLKGWPGMAAGAKVMRIVVAPTSMTVASNGNRPPDNLFEQNVANGKSAFMKSGSNDLAVIALDRVMKVTAPAIPLLAMNTVTVNKAAAAGAEFLAYGYTSGDKNDRDQNQYGYLWQSRGKLTPTGTYNRRVVGGLAEGDLGSRNLYASGGMSGGPLYVNGLQTYQSNGQVGDRVSGIAGLVTGGTTNDAGGKMVSTYTSFSQEFISLVNRVKAAPRGGYYIPASDENVIEPTYVG